MNFQSLGVLECEKSLSVRKPRLYAAAVAMLLGFVFAASVNAADIANFDKPVLLKAREQPIDGFIEELFGKLGVPVQISPEIVGSVNGDFEKSAREVFRDISSAFQLTLYFDGAVAHVYSSNDVVRSILPVSQKVANRVVDNARKLGFEDELNRVEAGSDGGLVVTGSQRFLEQIDELVVAIRGNTSPTRTTTQSPASSEVTFRVFRLKYGWADDVSLAMGGQELIVPGIATVLRELIGPGTLNAPVTSVRRSQGNTLPGLRGQGLQAVGGNGVLDPAAQNQQAITDNPPTGSGPVQHQGVQSTIDTRIVADTRLNAVIIRDNADRMSMYANLIESLDVKPRMLEIEATIIDLNTDRLRELGINWRLQGSDDEALFGNGTSTDLLLQPDANITPRGEGGIVSLVMGGRTQFIARIQALESQGAARIVSKPHVITLSNVEAILDTTSTFFVRVAGEEEVDLFNVSVGTTLRVTPHVFDTDEGAQIKLLVTIEDGSTTDRQVDSIPIIDRSTVNTQALIRAGQSLLIGGLVRESKSNTVRKVPLLGSVPGLGALFRSNGTSSTRVERMFLITPRLVDVPTTVRTLNAPIRSGEEYDIIETAPLRTIGLDSALIARDQLRELPEQLPPMRSSVTLTPGTVSAQDATTSKPIADPPNSTVIVPVPEPPTLRQRLPTQRSPSPLQSLPDTGFDEIVSTTAGAFKPDDEGWTEIPSHPVVNAVPNAVPQPLKVDESGWQEIR